MPLQPAIVGPNLRLGNFRLGYRSAALTRLRTTRVRATLGGVAAMIRAGSCTIQDVINDTPNTCALTVDPATPPTQGQTVRITINSDTPRLLFNGVLQAPSATYVGSPQSPIYPCTAIDDTARSNARLPIGSWTNVSATAVAQALVAAFAPGFTSVHVQASLPTISVIFNGSEGGMNACLKQIAKLIGGYFYWEDGDLHLFQTEATDTPDPIDTSHKTWLNDPPIVVTRDDSQLRTRVFGKGHGEALLTDVLAGETILPVANAGTWFGTIGGSGKAIALSEILAYTGVQAGGGGSLVGPGAAPSSAPSLTPVSGTGLGVGTYKYAYTDVTAAGETLPSPLGSIVTGVTAVPATGPTTGIVSDNGSVDVGTHEYAATYTTATGETTLGVIGPVATVVAHTAPAAAPGLAQSAINASVSFSAGNYRVRYTFIYSDGRVSTGSAFSASVAMSGSKRFALTFATGGAGVIGRMFFADVGASGTFNIFLGTVGNNTDTTADAEIGGTLTYGNGIYQTVPVTNIPTGPSGQATGRKLYRRFNGAGTFKLVATIPDNTTTTYTDTTANASLGADAPASNTATVQTVNISGIAIGASPTTSRKVYRTVVNGAQLKLLTTLANNTATTFADSTPDGSLGANAPTGDTSGITIATGQVNAGSVTLLLASSGPFQSGGGWTVSGIRYTGITGNTLTGIPASGPGAILTTLPYGTAVLPAPSLTGVTGNTLPIVANTPINIWVQRDDLAAQAAFAARTGTDGIVEHLIIDERRDEASLTALCDADLAQTSRGTVTAVYATRDVKSKSGKPVSFDLTTPFINETLTIQSVSITEIATAPGIAPLFAVTASNARYSLEDILRKLTSGLGGV